MDRPAAYERHFGLGEAPFDLRRDPRFFYESQSHRTACMTLVRGIRGSPGFVVLTGEAGSGKTTLLREVMRECVDGTRFIGLPAVTSPFEGVVDALCEQLDLPPFVNERDVSPLRILNDVRRTEVQRGNRVVLLVDEAQRLSTEGFEALRVVASHDTTGRMVLPVVLAGRPDLAAGLAHPRLRRVRRRVTVSHQLAPLQHGEIGAYVRHHLRVAGRHTNLFQSDAIRRIGSYTGGIPGLINTLCHAALLLAYAAQADTIRAAMIDEAASALIAIAARNTPEAGASPIRLVADLERGRPWPVGARQRSARCRIRKAQRPKTLR
jgi:general secretion pathway protein A